jgi:hypothetical protein
VKGGAAGAAWTYLLDQLMAGHVVCLGEPTPAARMTLERIAGRLTVRAVTALAGIERGSPDSTATLPDEEGDLVYVVDATVEGIDEALRLLAPAGVIYLETRTGPRERALIRRISQRGGRLRNRYALSPDRGEARSAVPAADRIARRYFADRGLMAYSLHPMFRALERWLAPRDSAKGRIGLLVDRSADDGARGIPRYLRHLAGEHGLDLAGFRYGLSARGQYNSRKVLFVLFPPGSESPTLVVKTTRDATSNDRLINEEAALRELASRELVPAGTVPEVAFAGDHGGLRFLAETVVEGASMRTASAPRAAAYRWITDLAVRSAVRGPAAESRIAARLAALAEEVPSRYPLTDAQTDALRGLVDEVVGRSSQLPMVFSHGDAATWNAVRLADGRIGFLDWEAAHADGLPLWDLWYYARSHVMSASRVRRRLGIRVPDVLEALRADHALSVAVDEYTARLQIQSEVVRPLFTLCWADRAVREITRLDARRVTHGHYIGLVRRLLSGA